jgi:drug/metabolite transporter (DMT)-like permease
VTTQSLPPSRTRVLGAFLVLYLVWGSTYLFIRWTVEGIPPFLAAGARHLTAGVSLYVWSRSRGAARPTLAQWRIAAAVGAMLLVVANGLVNWSQQHVPSGLASLVVSSVPIWFVAVDWLRPRGVRPSRRTIAGLALGSIGIAALVWSAGGLGDHMVSTTTVLVGCAALLFASFSWASGSVFSRQMPRHPHGGLATAMEMSAAGMLLLPLSWLTGDIARFDASSVPSASWWSLGYLIVFGSLLGFSAYAWLLRVTSPAKVATYAYVNPVVAVALGWAFAGERLTIGTLIAAAIILSAVVLITLPDGVAAGLRRRLGFRSFPKAAR